MKFLLLLTLFFSHRVFAGGVPLGAEINFIEVYKEAFEAFDDVRDGNLFELGRCDSSDLINEDPNFCDDPFAAINRFDVMTDNTGYSVGNKDESFEHSMNNVYKTFRPKAYDLLKEIAANDGKIKEQIENAFQGANDPYDCAASSLLLDRYGVRVGAGDINLNESCANTSLKSVSNFLSESKIRDLGKDIEKQMVSSINNSDYAKHVKNDLFPKVKELFKEKIISEIKDEKQKAEALKTLNKIVYNDETCSKRYGLSGNQAHLSGNTEVCLSAGYLMGSTSVFQIVHTLGHEIGHAFSSCSSFANKHDEAYHWHGRQEVLKEHYHLPKGEFSCSDKDGKVFDEITADTFGTTISYEFFKDEPLTRDQLRKGYSNSFFNLKESLFEKYDNKITHPSIDTRYKVLFDHPEISKQLGCGTGRAGLYD